jgi:hypothetical protein
MNAARQPLLGLVAVILGGCTYPTFDFGAGGAGATSGATAGVTDTATSTSTGVIGGEVRPMTSGAVTSGVSSSSVTGVSSAASGGTICVVSHPGGGTCEYLLGKECGCDFDKKCSVTKEDTGESQCINIGGLQQGQLCSSDSTCAAGFWCDHFTSTCEKICNVTADCGGGVCTTAPNTTLSASIPGLEICTANCNPITGQSCGNNTTCTLDPSLNVFDCFVTGNKTEGQACAKLRDCGKGLVCLGTNKCAQWCAVAADCKDGKTTCTLFNPPVKVGTTSYGYCTP